MTGRRQCRELALKCLYAYEMTPRDVDQIFNDLSAEAELSAENLQFARSLVDKVLENLEFLDSEIVRLAENWEIDRIALIDRIILRLALAEINYMPDIPEKVAINEAIELAKIYSTNESSSFVNGILDAAISGSGSTRA